MAHPALRCCIAHVGGLWPAPCGQGASRKAPTPPAPSPAQADRSREPRTTHSAPKSPSGTPHAPRPRRGIRGPRELRVPQRDMRLLRRKRAHDVAEGQEALVDVRRLLGGGRPLLELARHLQRLELQSDTLETALLFLSSCRSARNSKPRDGCSRRAPGAHGPSTVPRHQRTRARWRRRQRSPPGVAGIHIA